MMRAEPPRLLQIHRETVILGAEKAYHAIETDTARRCSSLGCPHAYLALQALAEPYEVWFLNGFESPSQQQRVIDVRAAPTVADAEAGRIADPPSRVLALRPSWSFPAPEWIAADPALWKGVDRSP
jgi:hypothetical protein